MFSQYFGHFLLNKGLISNKQLVDALEFQQSVHVKFGVLAINEGYMTPMQVEEVHEKQKQADKRFGEIAVDLGYLTIEQIEALISNQKQNYLFLAQALVERGYMTFEKFGAALDEYKKENRLSDDQFEEIKNDNIELFIDSLLVAKDSAEKNTYGKYLSLFAKNMIRFIDDQVYFEVDEADISQQKNWLVYQNIIGDYPLFTALSANEEVMLNIASAYAEEKLTELDELAKASISEFLNLQNGIYLVNMSNIGIELNMQPPHIVERGFVEKGESLRISVILKKGSFQLIVSDLPDTVSAVKR